MISTLAAGLVVWRVRALLYRSAQLEAAPFIKAFAAARAAGDLEGARSLAESARPAALGELASALVATSEAGEGAEKGADAEETLLELRYDLRRGLDGLRMLARVASLAGFLAAMFELRPVFSPPPPAELGLLALEAGLVERLAFSRAIVAMVVGVVTAVFCRLASARLLRVARELEADLVRAAADPLPPPPPAEVSRAGRGADHTEPSERL